MRIPDTARQALHQIKRLPTTAREADILRRSGIVASAWPSDVVFSLVAMRQWGILAGAIRVAARHHSYALGLIDERGALTFGQLDKRSNALARALGERGLDHTSVIGLLARDHRGFVETLFAGGKLGADVVLMNTGMAGPQLADVALREGVTAIVYDEEFVGVIGAVPESVPRYLAWVDDVDVPGEVASLEDLIAGASDADLTPPAEPSRVVMLTSGTTGTPKGAPRHAGSPLSVAGFLDRIPMRPGERTFLAAPLFHGTGLSQFLLTLALGSTTIVRRRFDPVATLEIISKYGVEHLVVVPTMLQRILALDDDVIRSHDTSTLRVIFCAGSALAPEVGNRATELFGEVVYNFYGSTEVAVATVATPADWKAAPGTVGRAPVGCTVRLYDDQDRRVTEPGAVGRVFVGSTMAFDGYTDGKTKASIDGLLASGDVGHFDASGLLFIDGRDDDMIVSGGENVFPAEVEGLLMEHPGLVDAVVIGVPDDEFGQRLKAYVVLREGHTVSPDEVRAHVRANLARHKVPRDVEFLAEVPRNATGKVLRSAFTAG